MIIHIYADLKCSYSMLYFFPGLFFIFLPYFCSFMVVCVLGFLGWGLRLGFWGWGIQLMGFGPCAVVWGLQGFLVRTLYVNIKE